MAESARESAETGYDTDPLQDELDLLCSQISDTLIVMGVEPPKAFPPELEACFNSVERISNDQGDDEDFSQDDQLWDSLDTNPYSAAIHTIFSSLNDVWGFYVAYVQGVTDDDENSIFDTKQNIESSLVELAASKIEIDEGFAPKVSVFRRRVLNEYQEWLTIIKNAAFRAGTLLKAELLDMVGHDAEELGHAAEAESFGLNAHRLHPDIYMNELLVGMRTIHQVLPAILKGSDKLEYGTASGFALQSGLIHRPIEDERYLVPK